jgi:hypothetical protein
MRGRAVRGGPRCHVAAHHPSPDAAAAIETKTSRFEVDAHLDHRRPPMMSLRACIGDDGGRRERGGVRSVKPNAAIWLRRAGEVDNLAARFGGPNETAPRSLRCLIVRVKAPNPRREDVFHRHGHLCASAAVPGFLYPSRAAPLYSAAESRRAVLARWRGLTLSCSPALGAQMLRGDQNERSPAARARGSPGRLGGARYARVPWSEQITCQAGLPIAYRRSNARRPQRGGGLMKRLAAKWRDSQEVTSAK